MNLEKANSQALQCLTQAAFLEIRQMILPAGCLKEGGAQVWLGHANFIVNIENATSKDVSKLMNKMYNEVKDKYTIKLVPEVKYIGIKSKEEEELWDTMLNKK